MKPGSLENLKFDKRLTRRRGWISDEDQAANLAALPDVSDKITTGDEAGADEESGEENLESVSEAPAPTAEFSEVTEVESATVESSPEAAPSFEEV